MSKKTNQFTAAYNSVFPQIANHKGSIYLTQNLIRKSVELRQVRCSPWLNAL